jgi:hypothetical protein
LTKEALLKEEKESDV